MMTKDTGEILLDQCDAPTALSTEGDLTIEQ